MHAYYIDILKHNTHNYTRTFLDYMYSFGLYPLITKPSRITDITATLIDNIFTNELQFQVNSGLLITDISDHLPVFAICGNQFVCRCATPSQYRRIINTSTTDKLIAELNQRTWPNVIGTLDVNLSYNNFVCEFQDLMNKHCPVKRVNNTENRYANNPWLTNGLKNACKKKNRLYKMFLSCRTLAAETRYKTYKNKLTSILRLSKKTYYSKLLVEHRNNIAETWQILRTVIGKHLKHSSYPNHFIVEGSKVDNKTEIANVFNNFFTNIGPDLANNIRTPTKTSVYDYLTSRNKKSLFLSPIDEREVISVVNGCKSKTSTDCDDIDFRLIKSVITSIVKPITHIFNLSFQTGTFPEKMKIAKVIPLFKSGSKNYFNNYRPISLLPQLSKILEKLYSNRLNTFTKTCDILNPCQYGFREKMSTTHALVKVVSEITNSLNKRKHWRIHRPTKGF